MPKFHVTLGRICREEAEIVVEARNKEELEDKLYEVYKAYEGDKWKPDELWGVEPSECHLVNGPADPGDEVDISLEDV